MRSYVYGPPRPHGAQGRSGSASVDLPLLHDYLKFRFVACEHEST